MLSSRCQVAPWSELRQRPCPTTLMTTAPLSRLTTTPEQPPGQPDLMPLLCRLSKQDSALCETPSATLRAWTSFFTDSHLAERAPEVGQGLPVVRWPDVFEDERCVGCMLGGEAHELRVIEVALARRHT